jgi:hypothetical protein
MANTNAAMVDLPFFELCNQAPVASSALACMTTVETGDDRFIYYISTSAFYRYDTVADTWQQLANPYVAPSAVINMRYSARRGYHGRVLSATSTTVQIAGLRGPTLDGTSLEVLNGTGSGQKRTLTYTGETIHEAGVITGTATNNISDSLKKWQVNQWAGYLVGITFGTDATQYKKVLYNDATTLYISDANLMPHDPWNNQPFVAVAPYALPVTTAGSQAHYQIMSQTFSVPAWTTIPDYTSFYTTNTGGIYVVTSAAAAPFLNLMYYDVLHDAWQVKTVPQSLILAAIGTDISIERTSKVGTALLTKIGTTSATARTLTDSGLSMAVGAYANYRLLITSGTGIGQSRRVVHNTATTFTIPKNWDVTPDATTVYELWPDFDRIYVGGAAGAAMYAYSLENDYWMQGQNFDDGITNTMSVTMNGWVPVGVTSGTRIATGIQAINSAPTAGGTGYTIGDVLTCAIGGGGAQVRVTAITSGGVVTALELINSGTTTGYTVSTGNATTGGTGTACTLNITVVGPTVNVVTATAAWFKKGDVVTGAGFNDALYNTALTILGVSAVTTSTCTFSIATTAAANMATANAFSTTTIVDCNKNWVVNEHAGRLVHIMVAGTAPTSQIRWIVSNTSNTLTFAAITTAVNGTSKYCIYDAKVFGIDDQRKETVMSAYGVATGGSTTTLIDSTKNWVPNSWVGYTFKVEAGTGYGSGRIAITANTATTLTYSVQSFTPDATTKYEIADAWGIATAGALSSLTDTTKVWPVNIWAGKRIRITAGTLSGTETITTANTANVLTLTGTPDTTSVYAIISIPARGAGTALVWTFGATQSSNKRSIYSPRGGGSNTFDVYDIATGRWRFGTFIGTQAELYNVGSSFSYDGIDGILLSRSVASNPIRIFKYNINTNKTVGLATTTFTQNTVHVGNFLEIVNSPTTLYPYLYTLQNTGTLLARAVLF